jgi:beta-glucosidase
MFRDADHPVEERIADLLSRLTLDEKIALLKTNIGVPRLGIPKTDNAEGICGLMMASIVPGRPPSIPTTTFPQTIGMSHTWSPDLMRRAGAAIAREARYIAHSEQYASSKLIVMAPNADLARDPRWGRTDETYGEDPYLVGAMSAAMVQGLQGNDERYWQVASLLKHFLANSNEDNRYGTSSDFDERLLHEYYAEPFRAAIEDGGARSYMAAYNAVNGIPCTVHPILRDLTQDKWRVDGIICTDFEGMPNLIKHHHSHDDIPSATAASINAGISQFLDLGSHQQGLRDALAKGLLTEADIDGALAGNIRVMIRLGLLDPPDVVPFTDIGQTPPWLSDEHRALARRITEQSIVLLKNEPSPQTGVSLLPVDPASLTTVAVLGPWADRVVGGLYTGKPPYTVSPLAGLAATLGNRVRLLTDSDPSSIDRSPSSEAGEGDTVIRMGDAISPLTYDVEKATDLARAADIAIVCVGNHPWCGGWWMGTATPSVPEEGMEALDRQSLDLAQEELVKAVHAANPNTVVLLVSSFPYAITWTQEHVPAILHIGHGSQELGNALADVLVGDVNPAGRLTMTWPRSLDQLPPMLDYDIRHGRTYMYAMEEPLYPFGHGLSYTTFAYADLHVTDSALTADHAATVRVDVTNTGVRAGDEVVQMYVSYPGSRVERPQRQLKGFRRIHLQSGETQTVSMPLSGADLAYWNVAEQRWSVESGEIEIGVGSSSADISVSTMVAVTA